MSTSSRTCHAMPLAVMFHTILVECPSVPLMGRARVSLSHGHPTAVELGLICRLQHLKTGPPAAVALACIWRLKLRAGDGLACFAARLTPSVLPPPRCLRRKPWYRHRIILGLSDDAAAFGTVIRRTISMDSRMLQGSEAMLVGSGQCLHSVCTMFALIA